jgi:hypothetical protein
MSGALIDLVAKGVQDVHLTGKPEVSFFRQMYKRHTNFSTKPIKLNIMGNMGSQTEVNVKIPTKGDLLSYMWIDMGSGTVADLDPDTTDPAEIELYIGGQLVDRHDATWLVQIWNKFMCDSGAKTKAMITSEANDDGVLTNILGSKWLPLHFFFCDHTYLPLVAIQYHEVELRIKFKTTAPPADLQIYANYILLDGPEREMFAEQEHSLLIEQVQKIYSDGNTTTPRFDLNLLNHPVKALFWINPAVGGDGTALTSDEVQLFLNGTDLFENRMTNTYFSYVQPYYHCEHASELLKGENPDNGASAKMYSFALKVSKLQPCGTCNFSRLDNGALQMTCTNAISMMPLYALNYNILNIRKGMAGVAYSN